MLSDLPSGLAPDPSATNCYPPPPPKDLTHGPWGKRDPEKQVQLLLAHGAAVGDVDPEAVIAEAWLGQHLLLQAEDLLGVGPLLLDDHERTPCLADHARPLFEEGQAGHLVLGHADVPGHGGEGW